MHPGRIQLYSLNTPNGVKVSIMLEETELAYEPHLVDIMQGESQLPEFLSLNPNGKIPAIIDPHGPGGAPLALFESGRDPAVPRDKTGLFVRPMQRDAGKPSSGVLPDGVDRPDVRTGRLLQQVRRQGHRRQASAPALRLRIKAPAGGARHPSRPAHLDHGRDYTIADIATLGWVRNLITFYEARELVGYDNFANVDAWLERGLARPAVQRGLEIPGRG